MTASRDRTAPGGTTEAGARLRTAEAYLQTAERVLDEESAQEFSNVAAGAAVLAGIAASRSAVLDSENCTGDRITEERYSCSSRQRRTARHWRQH